MTGAPIQANKAKTKGLGCVSIGLIFVVSIAALVTLYGWWAYPTIKKRYRLDVTFVVDGQSVTGSSVQELTISRGPAWFMDSTVSVARSIRGQAVAVDLPDHGTVYAILLGSHGNRTGSFLQLFTEACGLRKNRKISLPAYIRGIGDFEGSCVVPPAFFPTMVHFEDEADPLSVRNIDLKELPNIFGPDVQFEKITVTTTNAQISSGIGNRLTWLGRLKGKNLGGKPYGRGAPLGLHVDHFIARNWENLGGTQR